MPERFNFDTYTHQPSPEIQRFIDEEYCFFTDLRYSLGDTNVADVMIPTEGDNTNAERFLLVDNNVTQTHKEIWEITKNLERGYSIPVEAEEFGDRDIEVYRIPISARPLKYELRHFGKSPRNLMGEERIAKSAGVIVGAVYKQTGQMIDEKTIRKQIAIIEFQETDKQPIMFFPPISVTKTNDTSFQKNYSRLSVDRPHPVINAFIEGFDEGNNV